MQQIQVLNFFKDKNHFENIYINNIIAYPLLCTLFFILLIILMVILSWKWWRRRQKGDNTQGPDQIPSAIVKLTATIIEEAIKHTVNQSIEEAVFPEVWKDQEVFPNYKKDNYRPVNHINEFGKIGEYAVFEQLIEHHTKNNIFHSAHHGAIPDLSPHTAINTVIDKLFQNLN